MAASRQAGQFAPMSAQSHLSPLNPQAHSFSFGADFDRASSKALVRYDDVDDQNCDQNLPHQLRNLAVTYGDEILSLRKDVERLKQGGWMVTFGNQQFSSLDSSELEATRKRLERTHKSINAPMYTDDLPSSLVNAIEAAPQEEREASGPSGLALSKFSPQNTAAGDKDRRSPITPSGGLRLSRYAPKAPVTSDKITRPVSGNSQTNAPSNSVKSTSKPQASQLNGTQAGAINSDGTRSPQTKSNVVNIQATKTEKPLPKGVKFEDGATKEPTSVEHGTETPHTTLNNDRTQATKAEAPLQNSIKLDKGASKAPESNRNDTQTPQPTSNAVKSEITKAAAPLPQNVDVDCGATKEPESSQHEHPDTAVPTTEDPSAAFIESYPNWQPLGVRQLAPLGLEHLQGIPAAKDTITFSWDFIRDLFGGKQWSPGFYYKETKAGSSLLPSRSYYILDASLDPYLPKQPGMHGAKLTPYFNPENPEDVDGDDGAKAFERVPLFIAASPPAANTSNKPEERRSKQYRYFGMYSQPRYSDKLDYDRMMEAVPYHVKMHWATVLADPSRPAWVSTLLKAHVGDDAKPEYDGPVPDGTAGGCDYTGEFKSEIQRWVGEFRAWSKRASKHVSRLSKEAVLQAFEREDTAAPPGLRLWWEYLACDAYDAGFYGMLVHEQVRYERRRSGDPRFKQPSFERSALI
ncbi:hypothetical protein IWZ03DRAFT_8248 [Phyllosticta citriasiana]|uniref:DUF6697 domain-containing protein n=2 Tax=Phyllosticta citriasiana TaxID=595635 RepID=A0ABR1KYB8_9PEZI